MDFITVLGLVAASLTTSAFLPQAIKTIKTKHTKDLSPGMYSILTFGIFLWLVYGIFIGDIPIILANGITLMFCFIILFLIVRYK
jgi:MtN3 and saliva related transmembrane protein